MLHTLRPWGKQNTALYVGRIALLVALVAVALSCCSFAANGITLQIKDLPLKDVVMLLTQQSGTNLVIADESKLEKKVTATLNDVPLEKALDYIVKGAGVSYKRMDDGTYIIGGAMADDIAVVPIPNALPPVEPVVSAAPSSRTWASIKLVHSRPSELLRLLGWNGDNPMTDYEAATREMNKPRDARITPMAGGPTGVNVQSNSPIAPNPGMQVPNGQPVAPTVDYRATTSGAGRTASPGSEAGQVPGPPGYNRNYNQQGNTVQPNPARPGANGSTTGQNFLWPEGVDNAVPFDLDNSIIVKGDEQGIQDFKNIIRMLDVPPKQVSIKAEFVEVTTTDVKQFGIDWSLDKLNESFSAPLSGGAGNIVVGFATGNLTAVLRTQLTRDIGRVINSPIISTINNQNAYISINSQIPYWTSWVSTGINGNTSGSTPNFINVDTQLAVLPRVNGDGTITMTLTPRVQDTGNIVTGPDGTQIPETRSQELFTQRRVANGETIVVGGFIRKNDSNSVTKIPVLGDLPIVGSLFRGTNRTTTDRELLIFITPTIIPDSTTGSISVGGNLVP